jgi:general L-amino acid transport system permease protein
MSDDHARAFVRPAEITARPPPVMARGALGWIGRHLFGTPANVALTVIAAALIWFLVVPAARFMLVDAVWEGTDREACLATEAHPVVGACWPFIRAKFGQFIYGFYPEALRWRVDLAFAIGIALLAPLIVPRVPFKRANAVAFFAVYPVVAFVLIRGAEWLGLAIVDTRQWGGLLVTLVVSVTGIVVSIPVGVALALGRRSALPIVRWASVAFIEFWRGVPLITVLFFATYMLPLFLPGNLTIDALARVLVGVALFAGAYNAEVIRGGLQAIPRGQEEAASALGLGHWRAMALVTLPQAFRNVIPGLVNSFIALFKDTTLVLIVAIFDLLGQLRAAFADPAWATPNTLFTGFAFAGVIYFAISSAMSHYSQFVERRLTAFRRG